MSQVNRFVHEGRYWSTVTLAGVRLRVLFGRLARRMGMGEDSFLVPLAVVVGVLTAAAAVGFHELILLLRNGIYRAAGESFLYGRGIWLLVLVPTLGGLVVGVVSRLVAGEKEGHGVVDVMESVARTRGFVRFRAAIEKIFTSAVTIGTGGSAGAEGPIVQIGAAVSSGVGSMFRLARHQMPVLVGCGCAAGISAIFNAPIGGLLFTLEVILLDFSVRAITPIIVAAVIANVTMRAMVGWLYAHGHGESAYITVFADPRIGGAGLAETSLLNWPQVPAYVVLGLLCGLFGAGFIRLMHAGDGLFRHIVTGPAWVKALRPAVGGLMLGILGVSAVVIAHGNVGDPGGPFSFDRYPMPAFFGDGYPIIETLLDPDAGFYQQFDAGPLVLLLLGLLVAKLLATAFTLGSGGSGGVIAPSLFAGAVVGGAWGVLLRESGLIGGIRPEAYTLIGMAGVLAAVVHAPLASILILLELTNDSRVLLPALLCVVVALGTARLISRDSIYTGALKRRGVRLGGADPALLSRMTVEQVSLDPAAVIGQNEPFERVVELMDRWQTRDFMVLDDTGRYAGFLAAEDVNTALLGREAMPLMVVGELMRRDVPLVLHTDDLQTVFDLFARFDVAHLPVGFAADDGQPGQVIGMISRAGLMRRYRQELDV